MDPGTGHAGHRAKVRSGLTVLWFKAGRALSYEDPVRRGGPKATPPRGCGKNRAALHSAAANTSVAFLAPIQATTPNPTLLITSAML